MNLLVKVVAAPGVPGKQAMALCTEDGEMLPLQIDSQVSTRVNEIGTIRVTFYIDGDKIKFADNNQ